MAYQRCEFELVTAICGICPGVSLWRRSGCLTGLTPRRPEMFFSAQAIRELGTGEREEEEEGGNERERQRQRPETRDREQRQRAEQALVQVAAIIVERSS